VFHPSRLVLARQRRGLTITDLAARTSLSVAAIRSYERGDRVPSEDAAARIASTLQFPRQFFGRAAVDELTAEAVNFRALSTMRRHHRERALGAGAIAMLVSDWIDEHFSTDHPAVPDLTDANDPELAAKLVREEWGLGCDPIPNVVDVLEARGVRVFSLADDFSEVDAFSTWRGTRPLMFLGQHKSAERSRFDACHELGHLVQDGRRPRERARSTERAADQFASAMLMPRASLVARFGRAGKLPWPSRPRSQRLLQ
jgi:transcriptional regulator with XRE-family HTH domain